MKFLTFFEDNSGGFSSARLFAFIITITFCIDYWAHIYRDQPFDPSWTIVGVVLGSIGLKVAQRFGEKDVTE
jgi:hypothetical protein